MAIKSIDYLDKIIYKSEGNMEGNQKTLRILLLIRIAAIVFMLLCLGQIVFITIGHRQTRKNYNDLINQVVTTLPQDVVQKDPTQKIDISQFKKVDAAALLSINEDYIGWVDIPGTKISYPVVYAKDYQQYLRVNFQGGYSVAGTPFMDYKCARNWDSPNSIIYGHRMNDDTMFTTLASYKKQDYFKEHSEVHIYYGSRVLVYQIYSAHEAENGDWQYTTKFVDETDYAQWMQKTKDASLYDTNVAINSKALSLVLSTCKGGTSPMRMVIVAQLSSIVDLDNGTVTTVASNTQQT